MMELIDDSRTSVSSAAMQFQREDTRHHQAALIIAQIKKGPTYFSLETEGLIDLKKHGVSDLVIGAMMEAARRK